MRGPAYWRENITREELIERLRVERVRIQKMLQKREVREWYESLGETSQKRKDNRMTGTHLRELRAALGDNPNNFTMEYLVIEGEYVVDEWKIHDEVTQHFKTWFEHTPREWGFHTGKNDYARMWNDKEFFIDRHQGSSIPRHLLSTVWEAMQVPKEPPRMDKVSFDIDIKTVPTIEEFREDHWTSRTMHWQRGHPR